MEMWRPSRLEGKRNLPQLCRAPDSSEFGSSELGEKEIGCSWSTVFKEMFIRQSNQAVGRSYFLGDLAFKVVIFYWASNGTKASCHDLLFHAELSRQR